MSEETIPPLSQDLEQIQARFSQIVDYCNQNILNIPDELNINITIKDEILKRYMLLYGIMKNAMGLSDKDINEYLFYQGVQNELVKLSMVSQGGEHTGD